MSRAYYNENDPRAAAWLRELIKAGAIADGEVDERSIEDVSPGDLGRFEQCHFFAGIGGWSYALRLAGWPDSRPVWTGSCPCQPFSDAGRKGGTTDRRHLWPHFFRLIRQQRPATIFGEQVASKDGLAWLDIVSTDLEREGYAIGAADLCAAGIGAPHVRQRLWFVAEPESEQPHGGGHERIGRRESTDGCHVLGLADTGGQRRQRHAEAEGRTEEGTPERREDISDLESRGAYGECEWIECADGKRRPIEPGTFPLANGIPAYVGRLRGYGNAIHTKVAVEFVMAYSQSAKGVAK